jgi:hypothetical protein
MQEHTLLFTAIHELKIDVPVLAYTFVDNNITLYLYGGQVVTYSPPVPNVKSTAAISPSPRKKRK